VRKGLIQAAGNDAAHRHALDRRVASRTVLTPVVIPAMYGLIKGWRLPVAARRGRAKANASDLITATRFAA
jgi:hypothetical protein